MQVEIKYEEPRWCGYRKPAKNGLGIYLIGPADFEACERLPFPLEVCPCCGGGLKPARGYTHINPATLFDPWTGKPQCCEVTGLPVHGLDHNHAGCAMCNPIVVAGEEAGIIWIGEKNYRTARQFMEEAMRMGISRKIGALPNGFEIGKHYIYLAHRKGYMRNSPITNTPEYAQAIFTAFRPIRLDIVIDDPDNVPPQAIELAKRVGEAAHIIKVIPLDDSSEGDEADEW